MMMMMMISDDEMMTMMMSRTPTSVGLAGNEREPPSSVTSLARSNRGKQEIMGWRPNFDKNRSFSLKNTRLLTFTALNTLGYMFSKRQNSSTRWVCAGFALTPRGSREIDVYFTSLLSSWHDAVDHETGIRSLLYRRLGNRQPLSIQNHEAWRPDFSRITSPWR